MLNDYFYCQANSPYCLATQYPKGHGTLDILNVQASYCGFIITQRLAT